MGLSAELTVQEVGTYKAITSLYNNTQEYKNLEKRATDIQCLVTYIKIIDNDYVPAQVTEYMNKVQPNSSIITSARATFPSPYTRNELSLVLGQGVTGVDLWSIDTAPDTYINFSLLQLQGLRMGKKINLRI